VASENSGAQGSRGGRQGAGSSRRDGGAGGRGRDGGGAPRSPRSGERSAGDARQGRRGGRPTEPEQPRRELPGKGQVPRRQAPAPPRPNLPDEDPQLPRAVEREIDRVLGRSPRSREVALSLSVGSAAIDEGLVDVALEALAWAKYQAPRVIAVREAYGVALYIAEDFAAALTELQAYRRMSGRTDQNHLIADAERALGREPHRVAATVEEMVDDTEVPIDRRVEGAIVWAMSHADAGQLDQAQAVLRRFAAGHDIGDDEAALRFDYVVGDLAERAGDLASAREAFERVATQDDAFADVGERLDRLTAS
jgi:hypothetical protein